MLVIRLLRVGKKNQPSFKIVVVDKKRSSISGRFIEQVGFYNPLSKEKVLKPERINYWLSVGAKPSATIHNLLVLEKVIKGEKIPSHKKSKKQPGPAAAEGAKEKEQSSPEKPEKKEQGIEQAEDKKEKEVLPGPEPEKNDQEDKKEAKQEVKEEAKEVPKEEEKAKTEKEEKEEKKEDLKKEEKEKESEKPAQDESQEKSQKQNLASKTE